MNKLNKKLRNIIVMFLMAITVTTAIYPRKANAFEWDGESIRTIATVTSCVVAVLSYIKGYWDGEKSSNCNCNCNCNCNEGKTNKTNSTCKVETNDKEL
jgi:hypothetical protein